MGSDYEVSFVAQLVVSSLSKRHLLDVGMEITW